MSDAQLNTYRTWLGGHIQRVLERPSAHAATPAEAEITLLTLMEGYVAAWSLERGRSPERDVARVTALWRAACHRLRGEDATRARLASPAGEGFTPEETRRVVDGMTRVWDTLRAMCP